MRIGKENSAGLRFAHADLTTSELQKALLEKMQVAVFTMIPLNSDVYVVVYVVIYIVMCVSRCMVMNTFDVFLCGMVVC